MKAFIYSAPQRTERFTVYKKTNNAKTKIQKTVQAKTKTVRLNKACFSARMWVGILVPILIVWVFSIGFSLQNRKT